jgi:hypothetical protein
MAQADSNRTTKLSSSIRDPLTKSTHESITGDRGGMSSVTRRLAMNMIVTAAAASTLVPSAAVTSEADPILSLIENHKRANAELDVALKDLVPGTLSPDPAKEEFYFTRESDVRWDLATTIPMTLAGLLAKLKYVEGVGEGKFSSSGRPDRYFDEDDLKMILISAQDCLDAHLNSSSS